MTAKTSEGWTAIHLAAYYGMTGIIELLLEKGANIEEEAEGGLTALDLAASKGQEKTVWLLLKNGAKATIKALIGSDILIRSRTGLSYP